VAATALVGLVCAVYLASFAARTIGPMTAVERAESSSRVLWPRFWSDGFLPFKKSGLQNAASRPEGRLAR
jgi:hypothetical protein